MPPKTKSLSVPEAMQARYVEITALTDALCLDKAERRICPDMPRDDRHAGPQTTIPFNQRSCPKLGLRHCLHSRFGEFPVR